MLGVKLPHLERWNERRNDVADRYRRALERCAPRIRIVRRAAWTTRHAYHLFVIRIAATERDRVLRAMQARGIAVAVHYPTPIHRQPAFQTLLKGPAAVGRHGSPSAFPAADRLASEMLSLPICGAITDEEVDTVIGELMRALDARNAEENNG